MLSYMIVVNDNGELKAITMEDVEDISPHTDSLELLNIINKILDHKSEKEEEK